MVATLNILKSVELYTFFLFTILKIFFLMWTIFKVFTDLVRILLLFYILCFFGRKASGVLVLCQGSNLYPLH